MRREILICIYLISFAVAGRFVFPGNANSQDVSGIPVSASNIVDNEAPIAAEVGEGAETGAGAAEGDGELPPAVPLPGFARYKHELPDLLLRYKREGRYVIPVPLVGIDPDTGINVGAGVSFYQNGKKDSPFFRITPYKQLITTQVIATTKKIFQVSAYYDQPYIMDTPWRVRGEAELFYNPVSNYFGIGNDSLTLTYPGSSRVFGSYRDYKDALGQTVNGQTYASYDEYRFSKLAMRGATEYDLVGGLLRPLVGFQVARVWIDDYTGNTINGATEQPTHLRDDCNAGRAIGCNGGYDIYAKLGLTFDTRNFEPDPLNGVLAELTSELSPKFLGSSFNYGRLTSTLMGFGDVLRYKTQEVVIAGRFTYSWQFGDVPFYSMNTYAFTDQDRTGLGGIKTIRGYRLNRFIGPVTLLANAEIRYSFYQFTVFKQHIKLMAVPFLDTGRVFDANSDITFRDWKTGGGLGLHLAWNLSTVVSLDYAYSPEGQAFYMDFGHQF